MNKSNIVKTIILAVSLLLQLSTINFHAHGEAGDVDLSFDPGSGVNGPVQAVAVQPDGKVIIGGEFTTVKGLVRMNLARLNADGSSDTSFNPGAGPHGISSLVLQPDGKLLVGHYLGILRLNSDGSQDTNFVASLGLIPDADGGSYASVNSIAVQPDGKLLIGGDFYTQNGTNTNYGIARLNANGSADSSFDLRAQYGFANALALQPDGKVLVAGYVVANGTNHTGIVRLNTNGVLDNTFNFDQPVTSALDVLVLQPDGKMLVAGYFSYSYGLARLNANGSLDGSFNPSLPPYEGHPYVGSLVAQSDGKVLITGDFTSVNGTNRNGIARLNVNGSLDYSFDPGTGASGIASVALQSDGKVLIGRNGIRRLNADGSLDSSFDPGDEISGGDFSSQVASVAVQPDGKVLIGGRFNSVQGTSRNRIARLNADGTLDTTFDPGTGPVYNSVRSVALQPDGKVLIGGIFTTFNGTGTNLDGIARLNADGSLDSSFAPVLAALNPYNDCPPGYFCSRGTEAIAVVVQSNNKVLVGGVFGTLVFGHEGEDFTWLSRCFLARFNADGSLDTGFAPLVGNAATTALQALTVQPDGKVVVIGNFLNGTNRSAIIRINSNGTLDNSFNAGTGFHDGISSVALQADGKVFIGGAFTTVNGTNRNGIARLHTNGNLDSSFNPGLGLSGAVYSVASQPDGKVLIGRGITYDGTNFNTISRRNADGSPDASFNPGSGASGAVRVITVQPDGNVLIGGDFTTVNGVVRPHVARLFGDFGAPPPSLNITRMNASLLAISWPSPSTGFTLQQNTNNIATPNWSNVLTTPTDNGTTKTVTVNPSTGNRFFRLKNP